MHMACVFNKKNKFFLMIINLYKVRHVVCCEEYMKLTGTDKPKALKSDSIYNIDMLFWKKGFQAFIYIY